jgi:signal transduction histidine kinase
VLTELLGATMAVKSQLGKGTTFTLRLPVSDIS